MNKRNPMTVRISAAVCGAFMVAGASAEVIYSNDFEAGLRSNESTFSANYTRNSNGSWSWKNNSSDWGVHNGSQNPWVSGGSPYVNTNMSGNVLGHVTANYSSLERSFYEITVDLSSFDTGSKTKTLMFEFDSWIQQDYGDGFNVVAYNGSPVNTGKATIGTGGYTQNSMQDNKPAGWQLLSAITNLSGWDASLTGGETSDMTYDTTLSSADTSSPYAMLDEVSGSSKAFTGHSPSLMAGTALFDLSGFTGVTTIRFAFGSGYDSTTAEGLNIDKVKISGLCTGGTVGGNPNSSGGAVCDDTPPGSSVPEPTSLALAALGLVALRRKGLKRR